MKKRIVKIISIILAVCLIASTMCACNKVYDGENDTRTVVDMAGTEVTIPQKINTVANYSSICEAVVIGLGSAGKLAFTPESDQYNWVKILFPEYSDVPTIPAANVNVEEMVKMNIDIVFARNEWGMETLTNAGLNAFYVNFDTTENTYKSILLMADILGVPDRGEACVTLMKKYDGMVAERIAKLNAEDSVSAYIVHCRYDDSSVLSTFGTDSVAADMIKKAGATLITEQIDLNTDKGEITEEALLASNPEYIFVSGLYQENVYNELLSGKYNGILRAVDNGHVYRVPVGIYDRCTGACESGVAMLWFASTMHPELFEDIDIASSVKEYYFEVAGVSLTDAQITAMLAGKLGDE